MNRAISSSQKTNPRSRSRQIKNKRAKTLAIVGAVLLVLTFGIQEVLKERAKGSADSLQSAEALYRTELGQSVLSMQSISLNQVNQIKEIQHINATRPEGQRDYSDLIRNDLLVVEQMRGDLNSSFGNVSRLLDTFPYGVEDLREQLRQVKPSIENTNQQVTAVLKPSQKHDWTRAVEVKLVMILVAITDITVTVVGDAVLTRARQTKEVADKIYRASQWASYFLYTTGVALGLFAALSGIKSFRPE